MEDSDDVERNVGGLEGVIGDGSILAKMLVEFGVEIRRGDSFHDENGGMMKGKWMRSVRDALGVEEGGGGGVDENGRRMVGFGGWGVLEVCGLVLWCGVKGVEREVVVEGILGLRQEVQKVLAGVLRGVEEGGFGEGVRWRGVGREGGVGGGVRELERELDGASEVIGELKMENGRLGDLVRVLREREGGIRKEEREVGLEEGRAMRDGEVEDLMREIKLERDRGIGLMRNVNRLEVALQEAREREHGLEEKVVYGNMVLGRREKRVEELLKVGEELERKCLEQESCLRDERALSLQYQKRVQELEEVLGGIMTDQGSLNQNGSVGNDQVEDQDRPYLSAAAVAAAKAAQDEEDRIQQEQKDQQQDAQGQLAEDQNPSTIGSTIAPDESSVRSLSTRVPDELDLAADQYNVEIIQYKPETPPRDPYQTSQDSMDQDNNDQGDSMAQRMDNKQRRNSVNQQHQYSSEFSSLYSSKDGDAAENQEKDANGHIKQVKMADGQTATLHRDLAGPLRSLVHQLDKLQDRLFRAQEELENSESERSQLRANYSLLIKEIDNLQNQKDQLQHHEIELLEGKERLIVAISDALRDKENEVRRLRSDLGRVSKLKSDLIRERNQCRQDALRMEELVTQVAREKDHEIVKLETQLVASKELAKQLSVCVTANAELKDVISKTKDSYIQELLANAQRQHSNNESQQARSQQQQQQVEIEKKPQESKRRSATQVEKQNLADITVVGGGEERTGRKFSRSTVDTASSRLSRGVQAEKTARCGAFWKVFRRDPPKDEVHSSFLPRQGMSRRSRARQPSV